MKLRKKYLSKFLARQQAQARVIMPYDIFMVGLTILSVINVALYLFVRDSAVISTIWTIDVLLSGFFLIDFLRRLIKAPSRARYFIYGYGWADLLAIIPYPAFKLFRIIRLVKAHRLIQKIGAKGTVRQLLMSRASGALYFIFFLIIVLLEFGSIAVLSVERANPAANIKDASDAVWWVYVTIATVGYGDMYPTTTAGRFIGAIVMTVGVGLFAVLTGYLANKFLPSSGEKGSVHLMPDQSTSLLAVQVELEEIKNQLSRLTAMVVDETDQKK